MLMVGQGRPPQSMRRPSCAFRSALGVVALCLFLSPGFNAFLRADEYLHLRLRLQWGGAVSHAWQVAATLSEGAFADPVLLGRNPDDPGSIECEGSSLRATARSPALQSGMEISVSGPEDAKLQFEIASLDRTGSAQRFEVPLAQLIARPFSRELDNQRNQLHVERAPGDRLRLEFDRDSLVFEPNELFAFSITPNRIGLEGESSLRCRIQMNRARSDESVWSTEKELRVDKSGDGTAAVPIELQTPNSEGVYDVVLAVYKKRITDPLTLVQTKPLFQRKFQVVVLDPRPQVEIRPRGRDAIAWKSLAEIDPAVSGLSSDQPGSRWPEWLKKVPQWKWGGFTRGPLAHGPHSRQEHLGRPMLQLAPGSWQAYPLPIARPDEPHLLEIEYPSNQAQTLGISFIESDAAGRVTPVSGMDFGMDVPDGTRSTVPKLLKHRVLFWPRTKTPLLLVMNRRDRGNALLGRIAVSAGPAHLPGWSEPSLGYAARTVAISLDKPLFAKTLGGSEVLDAATGETRTDWVTFFESGKRLAEYLKHHGFNTAVMAVACEGSTLYPSSLLSPTPQYDTGPLFSTGQDPVRKDILEMLCRIFDREGLKLVPAIQFSTPLPALETLRREAGQDLHLDWIGADGQTWLASHVTNRGLAPYYNPLNEQVQSAMLAVAGELAERYGKHRSFAGVALQLGPDTYAQLPEDEGSFDDATVERFATEMSLRVPGNSTTDLAARVEFLNGEARRAWLAWRAEVMAEFYQQLSTQVADASSGAKLFLATSDLLVGANAQQAVRARLAGTAGAGERPRSVSEALLEMGLNPTLLADEPQIVLFRPHRFAPPIGLASQAANLESYRSGDLDQWVSQRGVVGVQHLHETLDMPLRSFDAVSPFGAEKTGTWLAPQFVPAADTNRRRFAHSLASLDAQTILEGGWTLGMGGEDQLQPFLDVYRQLPAERFQSVTPRAPAQAQPVTVRFLSRGNRTFVYAVNDSPWPITAEADLVAPAEAKATAIGAGVSTPSLEREGQRLRWKLSMEPYELQAIVLSSGKARLEDWRTTISPSILSELDQRLQDLMARKQELRNPTPQLTLRNAGFEQSDTVPIPGWEFKPTPDGDVRIDADTASNGSHSLHLKSDGEVLWIRSEPFTPLRSGRLAVGAKIRISRPDAQPELRIAVDDGHDYYPHVTVGSAGKPLSDQWTEYQLFIDNVPASTGRELRVGFDLMGAGEVWIDDVRIYGMWLEKTEGIDLAKSISQAVFLRNKMAVSECQSFLESFWPQVLEQYVPLPQRLAANPNSMERKSVSRESVTDSARESMPGPVPGPTPRTPTWRDKFNGMLPKKLSR